MRWGPEGGDGSQEAPPAVRRVCVAVWRGVMVRLGGEAGEGQAGQPPGHCCALRHRDVCWRGPASCPILRTSPAPVAPGHLLPGTLSLACSAHAPPTVKALCCLSGHDRVLWLEVSDSGVPSEQN